MYLCPEEQIIHICSSGNVLHQQWHLSHITCIFPHCDKVWQINVSICRAFLPERIFSSFFLQKEILLMSWKNFLLHLNFQTYFCYIMLMLKYLSLMREKKSHAFQAYIYIYIKLWWPINVNAKVFNSIIHLL